MSLSLGSGSGGLGGGGGGVGSGLPPTPPGYGDVAAYSRAFERKVGSLLSLAARPANTTATVEVGNVRRFLGGFLSFLEEARSRFPDQLPGELYDQRYMIKRLLVTMATIPPEGAAGRRFRFFSPPTRTRARDLIEWLTSVVDQPLPPPQPTIPAMPPPPVPASSTASRPTANSSQRNRQADDVKPVPADHPIWGVNRMMHGIAQRKGGKIRVFNPAYIEFKRPAKILGHNGWEVGQWVPGQLNAMYLGGHGESNAGISYTKDEHGNIGPAASIIMAEKYGAMDVDQGETITYCGTNSMETTRDSPADGAQLVRGNKALMVSKEQKTPVRVFRKAKKGSQNSTYAPKVGLRYDGLYYVTGYSKATNDKGGIYHKFTLQRHHPQKPLEDLRNIPSKQQRRDYAKIDDGY
ncbi:PUA-like domain-containing protein [Colletotrichum phormii]|uniref:PUA-like domain-containing protein n=1 Tax=Colletotrichum phormii TaxID=359342 RepID=A0AAI9ZH57_9PEZI|nr:PUA-like domain-containing protein [Colletotrichum phormii]KAK1624499.1 PUA-like domain-containing protein [Colletotrichum phormii]